MLKQKLHLDKYRNTLFGADGCGIGKGDLLLLDWVISNHGDIKHIVELGTYSSLTGFYLGTCAMLRGGTFTTFDIKDRRNPVIKNNYLDNMKFIQQDILSEVSDVVVNAIDKDCFILVDNGNKIKEFTMYSQYVSKKSIVIIHDWDVEIKKSDIINPVVKHGFKQLYINECEMFCSRCAVWSR